MTIKIWQTRTDRPEIARRWRWKRIDAETGKTIYQSVRNYGTREEAEVVVKAAREEMAGESTLVQQKLRPKIQYMTDSVRDLVDTKQSQAIMIERLEEKLATEREKSATLLTAFTEGEATNRDLGIVNDNLIVGIEDMVGERESKMNRIHELEKRCRIG